MTQEEKAKAYDNVVGKLKQFMAQGVDPLITRSDVQDFFPELKESENESIRKLTIHHLDRAYQNCEFDEYKKEIEKCIAWLEKQKEPMVEKCGDWSDVRYMSILQELHFLKSLVEYEQYINKEDISKNIEWLKSLKHRMKK